MIGLIMAGGKGTRMQSNQEKLLLEYKKPLVLHVGDATISEFRLNFYFGKSQNPRTSQTMKTRGPTNL